MDPILKHRRGAGWAGWALALLLGFALVSNVATRNRPESLVALDAEPASENSEELAAAEQEIDALESALDLAQDKVSDYEDRMNTLRIRAANDSGETKTEVRTKTVTKVVEKTPQSCLRAIALAGQGFTIAAKYPPLVSDAAEAGVIMDTAGILRVAAKMDKLTAQLGALRPQLASSTKDCARRA